MCQERNTNMKKRSKCGQLVIRGKGRKKRSTTQAFQGGRSVWVHMDRVCLPISASLSLSLPSLLLASVSSVGRASSFLFFSLFFFTHPIDRITIHLFSITHPRRLVTCAICLSSFSSFFSFFIGIMSNNCHHYFPHSSQIISFPSAQSNTN